MYAVVVGTYAGSAPFNHVGVVAARIEIGQETEASEVSLYVDPETQKPVYSGVVRACDIAAADMIGKLSEPGLQKLLGFCDNASIRKAFIDGHGDSSKAEKRGRDLDLGQGVGTGDEKQLRVLQLTERSQKLHIQELEVELARAKEEVSTKGHAQKRKRDDEITKTVEEAVKKAAKQLKSVSTSPLSLRATDATKLQAVGKKIDDIMPLLQATERRLASFDDDKATTTKLKKDIKGLQADRERPVSSKGTLSPSLAGLTCACSEPKNDSIAVTLWENQQKHDAQRRAIEASTELQRQKVVSFGLAFGSRFFLADVAGLRVCCDRQYRFCRPQALG
jgi:predicted oxidoreductase (fatty acid repression mutant protein)